MSEYGEGNVGGWQSAEPINWENQGETSSSSTEGHWSAYSSPCMGAENIPYQG